VALAAVFVLGHSAPVRAGFTCAEDLRGCYFRAALADTWSSMWAMGIDCELDFTDCARRAILGQ